MQEHVIQTAAIFLAIITSSQAYAEQLRFALVQAASPFAASAGPDKGERRAKKRQAIDPKELRRLYQQNDSLAAKLKGQGTWGVHAALIDQWVQAIWRTKERPTETDLFFKQLLVDVTRYPPDDPRGQKVLLETLRYRYSLTDDQVKLFTSWFGKKKHELFARDIKVLVPTAGEIVVTRLANKPFTPQQVGRWTKTLRPLAEQWWSEVSEELTELSSEHLTAMQQNMVKSDLSNLDRRFKGILRSAQGWEKGDWTPQMWGLENDPVHIPLQVKLTQERQAKALASKTQIGAATTTTMPLQPGYAVTTQPLRVGDGNLVTKTEAVEPSLLLPDENKWVKYVESFCDRYDLDRAQRASARAILRDLQERATAYRSSRSAQLHRLQNRLVRAESAEERQAVRADLREVLGGIDDFFEELKARLENIPTSKQRAGAE